jgi:hypothetical protein
MPRSIPHAPILGAKETKEKLHKLELIFNRFWNGMNNLKDSVTHNLGEMGSNKAQKITEPLPNMQADIWALSHILRSAELLDAQD